MFYTRRSNAIRPGPMCRFCGQAVATRRNFFCTDCLPMVFDFAHIIMSDTLTRKGGQQLCCRCRAILQRALAPRLVGNCIQSFRSDFERAENEGRDTSTFMVTMSSTVTVMEILVEGGDITEEIEKMIRSCHLSVVGQEGDKEDGKKVSVEDGAKNVKETQEKVFAKNEQDKKEIGVQVSAKIDGEEGEIAEKEVSAKDGDLGGEKDGDKAFAEHEKADIEEKVSTEDGDEGEKEVVEIVAAKDSEKGEKEIGESVPAKDGEGDGEEPAENVSTKNGKEGEKLIAQKVAKDGEENGEENEDEVFVKDEGEGEKEVVEGVAVKDDKEGEKATADSVAKDVEEGGEGNGDKIPTKEGEEEAEEVVEVVLAKIVERKDEKVLERNISAEDGEKDGEENGDEDPAKVGGDGAKVTPVDVVKNGEEGEEENIEYTPTKNGKEGEKGMGDYIFVKDEKAEGATGEHIFEEHEEDDENMLGDYVLEQLRDESEF